MSSTISSEQALYLFRELEQVHQADQLTPKEKVPKLRAAIDLLFSMLTADADMAFSNTHARMMFIQNNFAPPIELMQALHRFRIFANKVVHEMDCLPDDLEYLACLMTVSEAVQHFSGVKEPEDFARTRQRNPGLTLVEDKPAAKERLGWIDAVVLGVSETKTSRTGQEYCAVVCDASRLGKISVLLRDYDGSHVGARFSKIGRLLWKYARVYLYQIEKAPDKDDLYMTTPSSLVVIEPDYLIQVTDVAKCFEDYRIAPHAELLDKFHPSSYSRHLLLGSVVNGILDELICRPKQDFNELFGRVVNEYALELISLISRQPENGREFLEEFQENIQQHVRTLHVFVEELLREQDVDVLIEPTFYAPKYGLQGRLDLMIQNRKHAEQRDIVELKSGSAPDLNAYKKVKSDHEAQIQAYSLLLHSTYKQEARNSSILYSRVKPDEKPSRAVYCRTTDRQNLLWVRNHIVAFEQQIAANDWRCLSELFALENDTLPHYRTQSWIDFRKTIQDMSDELFAWFKAYSSFLMREQRIAKIGGEGEDAQFGFSGLWRSTLSEKRARFDILYYLEVDFKKSDFQQFHLRLNRSTLFSQQAISNFRAGDIAVLYPVEPNGELMPLSHQILKCTIRELNDDHAIISLRNKQLNPEIFKRHRFWVLEHDLMEKGYHILQKSLYSYVSSPNVRMQRLLMGLDAPRFEEMKPFEHPDLSQEQRELIARALSAKDYFLLQGPPGTGKTSFILKHLVRLLHEGTSENILLLAFTNRAVDEICEKLDQLSVEYFRLGFGDEKRQQVWKKLVRERNFDQIRQYFQQLRIVVSTVSSYLSNQSKFQFKPFHTAIVDEASQLLEPHLASILVQVERFILIGDEKQLPAVVTQSSHAARTTDPALLGIGLKDLSRSLFERLLDRCRQHNWTDAVGMITRHGRMHVEVAAFINEQFYGGRLTPALSRQRVEQSRFRFESDDPLEKLMAAHRLLFLSSRPERINKVHKREAQFVARAAQMVAERYGKDFDSHTLGIITPYRAQIAEIYAHLSTDLKKLVTIDTVERYQGSEREVILLSLAVNNAFQLRNLQSLTLDGMVDRKLNVALTRAREHVVVVGARDILEENYHYRLLIEWARGRGACVDLETWRAVTLSR